MTTIESRELPETFAVLRPTSGGGPSYQICKRTLIRELSEGGELRIYMEIDNADIQPHSDVHRIDIQISEPYPIYQIPARNTIHTSSDVRKIKWWFLPHALRYETTTIPIVDSNKRFFLTRSFRRIRPSNLTHEDYQTTIAMYGSIMETLGERLGMWSNVYVRFGEPVNNVPAPPPAPPLLEDSQRMPQFVSDLLLKDAVQKNQTCPITMTPLQELQAVGITSCYHIFDLEAILRWKRENTSCPFCRSNLSFVQPYHLKN